MNKEQLNDVKNGLIEIKDSLKEKVDVSNDTIINEYENIIEENITNQINSHLSLGKIQGIYFTDYIFLE